MVSELKPLSHHPFLSFFPLPFTVTTNTTLHHCLRPLPKLSMPSTIFDRVAAHCYFISQCCCGLLKLSLPSRSPPDAVVAFCDVRRAVCGLLKLSSPSLSRPGPSLLPEASSSASGAAYGQLWSKLIRSRSILLINQIFQFDLVVSCCKTVFLVLISLFTYLSDN